MHEGTTFEQDCAWIAHLDLTLAEAQQLLKPLQDHCWLCWWNRARAVAWSNVRRDRGVSHGLGFSRLEETLLMALTRGETFPEVSPIFAYHLRWLTVITRALPQGVCGSVEPPRPFTLGIKRTTTQAFGLTILSSRLAQADAVRSARKTDGYSSENSYFHVLW